jgi:hypothetical protein
MIQKLIKTINSGSDLILIMNSDINKICDEYFANLIANQISEEQSFLPDEIKVAIPIWKNNLLNDNVKKQVREIIENIEQEVILAANQVFE